MEFEILLRRWQATKPRSSDAMSASQPLQCWSDCVGGVQRPHCSCAEIFGQEELPQTLFTAEACHCPQCPASCLICYFTMQGLQNVYWNYISKTSIWSTYIVLAHPLLVNWQLLPQLLKLKITPEVGVWPTSLILLTQRSHFLSQSTGSQCMAISARITVLAMLMSNEQHHGHVRACCTLMAWTMDIC